MQNQTAFQFAVLVNDKIAKKIRSEEDIDAGFFLKIIPC